MPARARSFFAAAFGAAFGFAAGAAATLAVGTVPASVPNRDAAARCPYLSGKAPLPAVSGEAAPELRCPYASGAERGAPAPGQPRTNANIQLGPGTRV